MNDLIDKLKFKRIVLLYVIVALVAGLFCAGAVGYVYRDKIRLVISYRQLSERLERGALDSDGIKQELGRLEQASGDLVDALLLDGQNNILYSAKGSKLAHTGTLQLKPSESGGDFLVWEQNSDIAFWVAGKDEFMLSAVFAGDFSHIYDEYDKEMFYQTNFLNKEVYLLSFLRAGETGEKIYVIAQASPVAYGRLVIKAAAAAAMLLLMLYWVITALWVYQNAYRARLSAPFWGIAVLFTNLAGVLVYVLYKYRNGVCEFCGAAQTKTNLFCTNCGKEISSRCPQCGQALGKNDSYCGKCGRKIREE